MFHPAAVLCASGDDVNSCGVNTVVTENVGKLGNVLFDSVKHTGEQVAQIVRKHLLRVDVRFLAE